MIYRRCAAESRCWRLQGSRTQSSAQKIKYRHQKQGDESPALVIMNALILPVWGICGPTQRSTIGPQRYTVVEVAIGNLSFDKVFLIFVVLV